MEDRSFMRSLCMGEILEDLIFPFPYLSNEKKETVRSLVNSLEAWLKDQGDNFRKWDVAGGFPSEFIEQMRQFGLFSLVVPEEFGGLGLGSAAYSRVMQCLATFDASLAVTAGAHSSIGMRGLLLFGNDDQRKRYLPNLASGKMIAAFCLTEAGAGSDASGIKTKAVKSGSDWILNGEKIWITNGGIADFFTVFARTETQAGQMSAFIVTKEMPGVSIGPHEDKMGIRASSTTTVSFENVKVPAVNLLGEEGKGFKVAMNILNVGRTGLGGGSIGGMKRAIELATKHANQRQQFGRPIAEFGLVKQKIGHMVVECYATEAAVGMVAGLVDNGVKDYAVEAAISKVFASECVFRAFDEALQIAGGAGFMREYPYERALRDCRINRIFEGANEILRLFIALTAIQDVGSSLKEVASTLGTVLSDPIKGFGVLTQYAGRRVTHATGIGVATMTKVHPLLKPQAEIFEECSRSLAATTDRLLRKHGKNIIGKQFATRRLADIMIDLFVLATTISRVTSSIESQGQSGAAKEIEIAQVFAGQVQRRVRSNFSKIDQNDDELIKSLADHALTREKFSWDTI
ncbi:MAG: acyl-CoA dehydrogenase family protein [Deltaproteobacteria bacterium]|nr:acyl-CoA dehydrogenase family protein [Deltaproteobacteria bacterium]MBI3295668.1 acyl-CoA dehydrogenase family protein [Deltaproteobacteria bacterium]